MTVRISFSFETTVKEVVHFEGVEKKKGFDRSGVRRA